MWIKITDEKSLVETVPFVAKIDGESIMVIKIENELFALLNQCPHLGCTLHKGEMDGYFIKCPCHDWVFDIRTGEFIAATEIKLLLYQTKIVDGIVYIYKEGRVN